ncbi:MAG: hypothetical protein WBW48_01625 [Anaerolineae bacterium]
MKLIFHIPTQNLIDTYTRVRRVLRGNDEVIFQSMEAVTQDRRNPFILPANPGEFEQKHEEIMRQLDYPNVLGGRETAISLMEEIGRRIQSGGVVGVSADDVLDEVVFKTSRSSVAVRLNQDLRWAAEWIILSPILGVDEPRPVLLEIYATIWGEVVPTYVIEYVSNAIHAYHQGMRTVATVLLSIAVEATLRDVLETRGYTFNPGASPVDVFSYACADVGVAGNSYTLTFRQPMSRSPAQFPQSTGGDPTVEVRVRRVIKWRRGNRVDLSIIAPPGIIGFVDG